jgi:anti-sigma factor (TIGR02949 family)
MPRRLDCEDVLEVLEAHLDGDLAGREAAAVAVHLEGCAGCAAELELAASVRRELRALPGLDAPPAVLRQVLRQAGEARFGWRPAMTVRPAWAALAAAVFAAAVLGAGLWLRPAPQEPAAVAAADAAAVVQATEEARYALALVAQVGRRTGLTLRQDVLTEHLVDPSVRSLSRVLAPGRRAEPAKDEADNGSA